MVHLLDLTQPSPPQEIKGVSEVIDLLDAETATPEQPVEFTLQTHGVELVDFVPPEKHIKDIELRHDEDVVCLGGDTGEVTLRDYPHLRPDCGVHAFKEGSTVSTNALFCERCYCYACDKKASECSAWGKGANIMDHCNAYDCPKWQIARGKVAVVTVMDDSPVQLQTSAQVKRQAESQTSVPWLTPAPPRRPRNPRAPPMDLVKKKMPTAQKRVGRVRDFREKQSKKSSPCVVHLRVPHDPSRNSTSIPNKSTIIWGNRRSRHFCPAPVVTKHHQDEERGVVFKRGRNRSRKQ